MKEIDKIDLMDTIINSLRPIEHLFTLMDTGSQNGQKHFSSACSEIGIALTKQFRSNIEILLSSKDKRNQETYMDARRE